MTHTITARSAADFLALIPHLAGYTPTKSIVLVPFRGTSSAGLLRFDLPHADLDAFASTAIGLLCRVSDVDGLAIVVYAEDEWNGGAHSEVIAALRMRADACGLTVGDALGVMADGWGRYLDAPPRAVRSLREITAAAPPAPSGDQQSEVDLAAAPREERAAIVTALADIEDALHAVCGDGHGARGAVDGVNPEALEAIDALDESGRLWEEALHWNETRKLALPRSRAALVLWTLARPGMRDVALAHWCHGAEAATRALRDQLRWEAGDGYDGGPLFLAGEGPRPDIVRLRRARALCEQLAAVAEAKYRAAALACAAWVAWAQGAGTPAEAYAVAALEEQPGLGLAEIVRDLARSGRLPEWAFEPYEG